MKKIILILMLILLIPGVSAFTMQNVDLNQSGVDIYGYCEGDSATQEGWFFNWTFYKNDVLQIQSEADFGISTQETELSSLCVNYVSGGAGGVQSCSSAHDGSYSSGARVDNGDSGAIYENTSLNQYAFNGSWYYKTFTRSGGGQSELYCYNHDTTAWTFIESRASDSIDEYAIALPDGCFRTTILQTRVDIYSNGDTTYYREGRAEYQRKYQDDQMALIFSTPFSSYETGDKLVFSCAAYDESTQTAFLSSTPLYINERFFNVSFYDEETNNLIIQTLSLELITDSRSANYSTSNGNLYFNYTPADTDFIFRYGGGDYERKYYVFNSSTQGTVNISLYLLNVSQNVTALVLDEYLNKLEGALIVVQRYDLTTNSYKTVERVKTNFEGEALFRAELNGEFYRFLIYYDDSLVFSSVPAVLRSNSITFSVDTEEGVGDEFYYSLGIDYSLIFNNDTKNFKFIFSDPDGLSTSFKLSTHRIKSTGDSLYNETIVSTASGTILHNVENVTGYRYKSCAYVLYNGVYELLDCAYSDFVQGIDESGSKLALFVLALIMIILALLTYFDVVLALIVFPLPWIIFEYIGLTTIGIEFAVSLEILMIITALIVGRNR